MLSLRARFMLGAALWTVGLFALAGLVTTQIMFRHPQAPVILHNVFAATGHVLVVALLCMAAGFWQVRQGLSTFRRLRDAPG